MKQVRVFFFFLILLLMSGCGQSESLGDPTIEGHLMRVDTKEIFIVKGISSEQAKNLEWVELTDSTDKRYEAYVVHRDSWFEDLSKYEVGQKVKVWGKSGANESYPPQITAEEITIVK